MYFVNSFLDRAYLQKLCALASSEEVNVITNDDTESSSQIEHFRQTPNDSLGSASSSTYSSVSDWCFCY